MATSNYEGAAARKLRSLIEDEDLSDSFREKLKELNEKFTKSQRKPPLRRPPPSRGSKGSSRWVNPVAARARKDLERERKQAEKEAAEELIAEEKADRLSQAKKKREFDRSTATVISNDPGDKGKKNVLFVSRDPRDEGREGVFYVPPAPPKETKRDYSDRSGFIQHLIDSQYDGVNPIMIDPAERAEIYTDKGTPEYNNRLQMEQAKRNRKIQHFNFQVDTFDKEAAAATAMRKRTEARRGRDDIIKRPAKQENYRLYNQHGYMLQYAKKELKRDMDINPRIKLELGKNQGLREKRLLQKMLPIIQDKHPKAILKQKTNGDWVIVHEDMFELYADKTGYYIDETNKR